MIHSKGKKTPHFGTKDGQGVVFPGWVTPLGQSPIWRKVLHGFLAGWVTLEHQWLHQAIWFSDQGCKLWPGFLFWVTDMCEQRQVIRRQPDRLGWFWLACLPAVLEQKHPGNLPLVMALKMAACHYGWLHSRTYPHSLVTQRQVLGWADSGIKKGNCGLCFCFLLTDCVIHRLADVSFLLFFQKLLYLNLALQTHLEIQQFSLSCGFRGSHLRH